MAASSACWPNWATSMSGQSEYRFPTVLTGYAVSCCPATVTLCCACIRFQKDPAWSETGDRYLLKLFRDHLFHQVTEAGTPWIDLSHIVSCLNKVSRLFFYPLFSFHCFYRRTSFRKRGCEISCFFCTAFCTSVTLVCSFSWTQAFLRRSAWCPGTRKASWSSPTLTSSAALTAPSRSCSPWLPALCSTPFGLGVGLP